MSDSNGAEFDPRFDPAFQPGFDPDRHPRTTRRQPADATPFSVESPALERAQTPSPQPEATVIESPSLTPDVATAVDPAPARPDALLVALWIVSAIFVATGIYGLRLISDRVAALTSSGGFGGPDYYLLQAYTFGAPMLIILGLATATGTLFLLAARRLHR